MTKKSYKGIKGTKSHKGMAETVYPIKNLSTLHRIQSFLLHNFKAGRRNYTIWQVGKATLLRASDVLKLRYNDVFDRNGKVRENAFVKDQKTQKNNTLYLNPVHDVLVVYRDYLKDHHIHSEWLFPSSSNYSRHINPRQFYRIIHKTADYLDIQHLGTHSMRKTGAYMVYKQTHGNIAFVQSLLNQSSEKVTLRYLGLNDPQRIQTLNSIDFHI